MRDTSQGPGWWLASDGKWYPPETAPPLPPPPPPPPSASEATASRQNAAEGVPEAPPPTTGVAPTFVPGAAPPPPGGEGPTRTIAAKKPLVRRPMFWGVAAAVVVVIIVIAAVAGGNNKNKGLTTQTTLASSASTGNTGSNSSSTGNSGTTTTTTQPSNLPIGTSESITQNGAPWFDVSATQFVDPAQPSDSYITPTNAGDRFVAVAFTIKSTGSTTISEDIYNDTKLYDSTGQGFDGDFEAPSNGPEFPSGEINASPGGTASGWEMFEVPGNASGLTVTFTPNAGYATQAATTWTLGN